MTSIEIVTASEEETMRLAARLGAQLAPGGVVALDGPLGAGKTCFVRGLARGLGLDPRAVSSPTFVVCQEYAPAEHATRRVGLVHIDAYRLSGAEELFDLGFEELLSDASSVIAIEWAERVREALPIDVLRVRIDHLDTERRRLTLHVPASMHVVAADVGGSAAPRTCPMCGEIAAGGADPFCSERCKLADLHRWFGGSYRVSRPAREEEA